MTKGLFSCPILLPPPTSEEDDLSVLRLIRSRRVGATTYHRLIAEHGSASEFLLGLVSLHHQIHG
ncbi:hypothetical protein EOM89_07800, partial [Candidatus Falkowbacteria bacterium]|nr:hypothetical protein [Candidatus Falkowbacteria bacterium]